MLLAVEGNNKKNAKLTAGGEKQKNCGRLLYM